MQNDNYCKQKNKHAIISSKQFSKIKRFILNKKINFGLARIGIKPNDETIFCKTPYSIFNDLVSDCENSNSNVDEQKENALQSLYCAINNISPIKEFAFDIISVVGKFFSYFLIPFCIFSAVYDWFCQKRRESLDKTIRQPLFEAVQNIIELNLGDDKVESLSKSAKLKYIALLSSLDRKKTREILRQPLYENLLSEKTKNEKQSNEFEEIINENEKDQALPENVLNRPSLEWYEIFIQSLRSVLNFSDDEWNKFKEDVSFMNDDEINVDFIKLIYKNLTLGQHLNEIGCEREILPINESPYKVFGSESTLYRIFLEFFGAFCDSDDEEFINENNNQEYANENYNQEYANENCSQECTNENYNQEYTNENYNQKYTNENYNQEYINENYNQKCTNENIKKHFIESVEGFHDGKFIFKYDQYISNDGTLFISIDLECQVIAVEVAKKLGLITPEKSSELENQNVFKINLMFVLFRQMQNFHDFLTCTKNILNGVPIAIKHADRFTQALVMKINHENESNNIPIVPLFIGFSMGGMSAQAMAIKYGYSSITFNPLGLGKGILNYIGKEQLKIARDDNHAHCYQTYFMKCDWVSDPKHNLQSKLFINKPKIGQSYIFEDFSDDIKSKDLNFRHNNIDLVINDWAIDSIRSRIFNNSILEDKINKLHETIFNDFEIKIQKNTRKIYMRELNNDQINEEFPIDEYLDIDSTKKEILSYINNSLDNNICELLDFSTLTEDETMNEIELFVSRFLEDKYTFIEYMYNFGEIIFLE